MNHGKHTSSINPLLAAASIFLAVPVLLLVLHFLHVEASLTASHSISQVALPSSVSVASGGVARSTYAHEISGNAALAIAVGLLVVISSGIFAVAAMLAKNLRRGRQSRV